MILGIEAKYGTNDVLSKIKNDNNEIKKRKLLKQNKNLIYKRRFSMSFQKYLWRNLWFSKTNDKIERNLKILEEEIDKSDINWKRTLDTKKCSFLRS